MNRDLHGVFVRGAADNPVAIFGDADEAQRWRRANHGDNAAVVPLEATVTDASLKAARESFAAAFPADAPAAAPEPGSTADPQAELRGRIRAEESQRRQEAAIRAEVVAELEAEEKAAKAERKDKD